MLQFIFPVVVTLRYLFMALTLLGFSVGLANQEDLLGSFFTKQLTDAYFRTFLITEACFWCLKYKKLSNKMTRK